MSSDEKRPLGKILLQRKLVSQQELEDCLQCAEGSRHPRAARVRSSSPRARSTKSRPCARFPSSTASRASTHANRDRARPPRRRAARGRRDAPHPARSRARAIALFLAMADPHDKRVVDELEFVTGKKVYPYIAVHSTLIEDHRRRLRGQGTRRAALPRPARPGGDPASARAWLHPGPSRAPAPADLPANQPPRARGLSA